MKVDRSSLSDAVDRETARSVSKLLLSAVALAFVLSLVTLLPGVDRFVPETPVTFAALVGAIATVVVVGVLLYLAPQLAALTRLALTGPQSVVENVASVVHWVTVLAAVLVAHSGFAGLVTPFLDGAVWLYDVAFLLLALPPLVFVAARLYVSVDPTAELFADRVAGGERENTAGDTETATTDDTGTATDDANRA